MPGQIETAHHILGQAGNIELRQNPFQVAPMEDVQLAEGETPAADFLHRRLVFAAPGIGEGEPVERMARGFRMSSASRAMLLRQSTSVPNTSKKHALGICMMLPCPP